MLLKWVLLSLTASELGPELVGTSYYRYFTVSKDISKVHGVAAPKAR